MKTKKLLIPWKSLISKVLPSQVGRVPISIDEFFVGSTEAPSKVFPLFFLFSDWLKSNYLRSRIERGFSDIFRAIFVAL